MSEKSLIVNSLPMGHGLSIFFVGRRGGQILPFSELFLKVSLVYWLFPLVVRRL